MHPVVLILAGVGTFFTGLALLVAAGAVGIGVPLAVLAVRTDLPLRRTVLVLGAMPLVIVTPDCDLASATGPLAPRCGLFVMRRPIA